RRTPFWPYVRNELPTAVSGVAGMGSWASDYEFVDRICGVRSSGGSMMILGALLIATLWLPPQVTIVPGDSARGAGLFVAKGCIQCHSVNGQGGRVAPDLARPSDESHSPSKLA